MFYAWGRHVSSKVKRQQLDKLADPPLLRTLLGAEAVAARRVLGPRDAVDQQPAGPVPQLGGPQPGQQDACPGYTTTIPAKTYLDTYCSYSTNEITIYWNAALVYLLGGVMANQ